MNTENKENHSQPQGGKGLIVSLLLVSILSSIVSGYFFSNASTSNIADQVMSKYMEVEYKKAGGKEAYELLTEAQQLQTASQLPQIKEFIAKQKGAGAETPTA